MAGFMRRYEAHAFALARIFAGVLFLCHGAEKLLGFPAAAPAELPDWVRYGAGTIELVGGALIAIGLFTRWAAFVASGLMAAAYWLAHGMHGFFPILNGGELAVLYCFVFLYIAARGAGIWSVDAMRGAS
jgi:putative oxidoreductase